MELSERQSRLEQYFRILIGAYVIVLVLAVYPYTDDPTGDIKRAINGVAGFGLAGAWVLIAWWNRLLIRTPRIFPWLVAAFLSLYVIAALGSEARWVGLVETSNFASLAALYWVTSQAFRTTRQIQRLLLVLVGAVVLAALYGFTQKLGFDPFPWADRNSDVYTNIPATYGNPNFAAHVLILTIIVALYLLVSGFHWLPGLIALAIMVQHFYFTSQRAGMIALAAAAAVVLVAWLAGKRGKRPFAGAAISLAIIATAGIVGSCGAMAWSKWHGGTPIPLEPSLVIRYQSYISAPNMLSEHPLLGFGPGVYGRAYPAYWTQFEQEWFAQELRMNAHVHNDLMEIALDAGLPAAGMYLTMLVLGMCYGLMLAFLPGLREHRRMGYMFAAFFAAFFVDGLFGFNLRVPVSAALFFLMMGLLDGIWASELPDPAVRLGRPFPRLRGATLAGAAALIAVGLFFLALPVLEFLASYNLHNGLRAQAIKNYPLSRAYFTRGEELAPWRSEFARRLGQVSMQEMNLDQAVAQFDRSLRLNPHYVLTHLPMAEAKMLQAQRTVQENKDNIPKALESLKHAEEHLQQLLDICPMFPQAHNLIGKIAYISAMYLAGANQPEQKDQMLSEWQTAEKHLMEALKYELDNKSELYRTLAKVRIALQNPAGAEQALARAIQIAPEDPENGPLFLDFALHHKRYDRFRNALYAQIHLLKSQEKPNLDVLSSSFLLLANVLENGYQDLPGADQAYLSAVDANPLRPEVWTNFARYAYDKNRKDSLFVGIAQSCGQLQVKNQPPLAHVAAVNVVLQQGPPALEKATTLLLSHVRAYRPTTALSTAQTFSWAAKILLEQAAQAAPETPGLCIANFNLAVTLVGLEELESAQKLFAQAQSCLPEEQQPFLAIHWADTFVRQNRTTDALDLLRQTVAKYPTNLDAHWALARTLVKAGQIGEAKEQYQQLLQMPDLAPEGRAMLEKELSMLG